MVFKTRDGSIVKLDHGKPGDGTQWVVATFWGSSWSYDESTCEPGDFVGAPIPDPSPNS
jgi:hypothetical protein